MNIFGAPTNEMQLFASRFGGVVPAHHVSRDPSRAGAHRLIAEFGSYFENAGNTMGTGIDLEVQVFSEGKQNAVCSLPRHTILIGYNEGLKALIGEVALAIQLLKMSPKEFSCRRDLFQFLGLERCHYIGHRNTWSPEQWTALTKSVPGDVANASELFSLENYLLLFILLHEFMHGVLGHAHVLASGRMDLFWAKRRVA